ncbi:glycerate kinase type-2 family protein [Chitinophaga japonensis]|uniref:Glycerate 2-kinase n=1 Tax=Chitinophaga japonensis TaxID=104662 RepID=A0A562T324_CHIJA|nr:glycerate kinase [Chitinophaga japonensis]TWI87999.1 glycerate 2-kinase [Chitinophaga japonensis]
MSHAAVADAIFRSAVAAVQPQHLIPKQVQVQPDGLLIAGRFFRLQPDSRVFVTGAGKASAAMAQALEARGIPWALQGLIITKYEHALPLQHIRVAEAGHPVPDHNGVEATRQMLQLLESVTAKDLVIFLLSGGASALLADYPPGSSLADVQALFDLLLKSGAGIHEMNTVRKHISAVKGGQLAARVYPAPLCSLILSDVVGDDLDVIGSGPTVPDRSTFADTMAVLEKYHLTQQVPASIQQHLQKGLQNLVPDTPKPGHTSFHHTFNCLVGTNSIALEAAARYAETQGYHTTLLSSTVTGNAHTLAQALAQQAIRWAGPRPACLLMGGESTVTVTGQGLGGRNQQLALAAGITIQPYPHITILSAGTDGTDGPTDAAGAVVDAGIMQQAADLGLDPVAYLENNDAYHFFATAGGLIKTGPTQTNVMDIMLALIS